MHIKQSHITKKYTLLALLFFVSIMGTIVSVVANDSTVDTRANTIFEAIKSNANQMNPSDVSAYYSLVRMNIATLLEILKMVDSRIETDINTVLIDGNGDQASNSTGTIDTSSPPLASTGITKTQRDAFIQEVKNDLNSRITEDNNFVYIDGELAITKAKYDHKNFGKTDNPYETVSTEAEKLVCPTGYEFARVKPYFLNHGDYSELDVSPLTLETLGYYINQVANGEKKTSSTVSSQQKVNSLYKSEVVDDRYRLTSKIYDGAFRGTRLQSVDVCTQEFGHQWQISTSQAGLDATKKFTDTAPSYERIWNTIGDTLIKPNENNCYSYQVNSVDGYMGNYKSSTYKQKRSPNEWSESCTEKAHVVCEHNGKPDNYNEGHLSFTGVRVLTSASSGVNPIKHTSETGVTYWSAQLEDVKSTGFFVAPTNINKNFGGSEQGTRYWSGRMQIMYFDLTKAGEDWKNPDAKYTTYNTRTYGDIYQDPINPVLCQKIGTQASKNYPQNIASGDKTKFPLLNNIDNVALQDYDYLYFQRLFRHNLDSNVLKYGQDSLEHANAFQFYRYRGRQFLLHTFELMKNYELHIADVENTHKLAKPNFEYHIPIWDNGYYFPVSEKK